MEDLTKIILENEGLIYKSMRYFQNSNNKEDLYQAGCLGITKALKNYNPNSKAKFSTYAYSYIIGEMKNQVKQDKMFKVSRDIYHLKREVDHAREVLSQSMMRCPTDTELSQFLEIPEYYIAEALNCSYTPKTLDATVGDTNLLMYEIINSPTIDVDDLIYLKTELESLDEPERTIMIERYYEDMTQSQIAHDLGISQVDVSRKEAKVLSKIKAN